MIIENITNPNHDPQDGDKLKYTHPSGAIEIKTYNAPQEPTQEDIENEERQWRNKELGGTDLIVSVTDHPQHAEYLTYRQELRDYPQQADFPNGERPIKP
jgi:hypothetical protein